MFDNYTYILYIILRKGKVTIMNKQAFKKVMNATYKTENLSNESKQTYRETRDSLSTIAKYPNRIDICENTVKELNRLWKSYTKEQKEQLRIKLFVTLDVIGHAMKVFDNDDHGFYTSK